MENTKKQRSGEFDDQQEKIFNSSSSNSNSFTCEICIEPIPPNQEFKNYNNNYDKRCCDHHHDHHHYCSDCIAKYIEAKIEDYSDSPEVMIKCPGINCDMVLDPLSCRSILPTRVFDRWCAALCESTVHNILKLQEESSSVMSNNRSRAYCPYSSCSELILNECGDNGVTKLVCPNCRKLFCFQCQIPWGASHQCGTSSSSSSSSSEMMTVEQRTAGDRNDILFMEMVERNKWARCPTCNQCIERRAGCVLITCRCKTNFCYDCGSKLSSNGLCVCGRTKGHQPYREPTEIDNRTKWIIFAICFVLLAGFFVHANCTKSMCKF